MVLPLLIPLAVVGVSGLALGGTAGVVASDGVDRIGQVVKWTAIAGIAFVVAKQMGIFR